MRYSIVQGARQSFTNAYSGVLRIFATRMLLGKAPVAYEDGLQLRDYVYVGDVAAANLLALEDGRANGRYFNVGGGHATTVLEFGAMVARAVGKDIRPNWRASIALATRGTCSPIPRRYKHWGGAPRRRRRRWSKTMWCGRHITLICAIVTAMPSGRCFRPARYDGSARNPATRTLDRRRGAGLARNIHDADTESGKQR